MADFQCFCGESFGTRDLLVEHNVDVHGMQRDESQRAVDQKYPA
jgi:hypothetical protein